MHQTVLFHQFRDKIEKFLDKIASSQDSLEIEHKGQTFIISVKARPEKLANLEPHPDCIAGDPEDIVHIDWSGEWR